MYALNLDEDGRVLSATYPEYAPEDAVCVYTLPDGDLFNYRYSDGEFIYDPLPEPDKPEPAPTTEERLAALEEQLAAAKILLGVE